MIRLFIVGVIVLLGLALLPAILPLLKGFNDLTASPTSGGTPPGQNVFESEEERTNPIGAIVPRENTQTITVEAARINIDPNETIAGVRPREFRGGHFITLVQYIEFLRGSDMSSGEISSLKTTIENIFPAKDLVLLTAIGEYGRVLSENKDRDDIMVQHEREIKRAAWFCADVFEEDVRDLVFDHIEVVTHACSPSPFIITSERARAITDTTNFVAQIAGVTPSSDWNYFSIVNYYQDQSPHRISSIEKWYLTHATSRAMMLKKYWNTLTNEEQQDVTSILNRRLNADEEIPIIARSVEDHLHLVLLVGSENNSTNQKYLSDIVFEQLNHQGVFAGKE